MRPRSANVRKTVLVLAVAALALSGCDWPQFRNGPDRTGAAAQRLADFAGIPGIVERWSGTTGGAIASSPAVAGGIAYVGSSDAKLYAYDATTGAVRWSQSTGGAVLGSPAVAAGVVYTGSADNKLYAFDAVDGTPKWSRTVDETYGGVGASPALVGERVYIASASSVYALDATDGATVWASPLAGPLSPPAVVGGLVYVTAYANGSVTALHESDGTVAWTTPLPGERINCPDVLPTAAVSSGVVYASLCPAGEGEDSLSALDATTGAIAWSAGDSAFTTSPAVASGLVYVGSAPTQTLEARNVTDGSLAWAGAVGDPIYSSPTVAKDVVFVGTDDGSVLGFDAKGQVNCGGSQPRTCQSMWSKSTGGSVRSSPAVSNGFLYVGSDDGSLHAYGLPPISFSKSRLQNVSVSQPTVVRFGPDHRLYVAQYNGQIKALTITRDAINSYRVTNTETINLVRDIPNHNDDGTLNPAVTTRLVTGMAVSGTASSPIVYVASSDPRVGGGSHGTVTNLDTNSGVISRLTRSGSSWTKQDLVRGLPRSEENHATNALVLDSAANVLYAAQGGNTNMGAPSNNFNFLPEYAYSAAILRINLGAIGASTYDLPTLVDEDHPGLVGPFGGNGGKHQAKITPGSPVQLYATGFRNAFALVRTRQAKLIAVNNGPNAGWGGLPIGEGTSGACTNQKREGGLHHDDSIHLLSDGYYGGHPNPTRANRANRFNTTNPQSPVPSGHAIECDYRGPANNGSLATLPGGTTGMAQYTASNLANQLADDLLIGSVDGTVYRATLDANGTKVVATEPLFSNLGGYAIDIAVQGDAEPLPGTIWVPNLQLNVIDVFEPSDFGGRPIPPCSGAPSGSLDEDHDGFSNADEIANGTDPCSSADAPHDWDHDFRSDLLDGDDDNDGTPDTSDAFAVDASNGLATDVPIAYSFQGSAPGSPCAPTPMPSGCPGGITGLGFTGLMNNGSVNYEAQFDPELMTVGGAAGVLTVDQVPPGDALGATNTQQFALQYGVRPSETAFTVHAQVLAPFAGITPAGGQSLGVFLGTGDQDNYVKLVVSANNGSPEIQLVSEVAGIATVVGVPLSLIDVSTVDLYLTVNKSDGSVVARYRAATSTETGALTDAGTVPTIPASWLDGATQGLALGLVATSAGATPYSATWSLLEAMAGPPL